jgi:hypothetical protein
MNNPKNTLRKQSFLFFVNFFLIINHKFEYNQGQMYICIKIKKL